MVGALWVYFFVPETKGRTLEEMDELFGEVGFAQADVSLKARIEREIGLTALLGDEDRNTSLVPHEAEKASDKTESPTGEMVEEK